MDPPCTECIQGTIHEGQPQGKIEVIHGLNTYVVGNRTNPRGIIVVYSDVFGLSLPNNKIIADSYTKSGEWLVYLPDFFEGDPLGLKLADILIPVDAAKQSAFAKYTGLLANVPSYLLWAARHKEAPTNKACMDFLAQLRRATPRTQKIGIVGFCWGGKYAIRAGLKENVIELEGGEKVPLVDAAVGLHPSHLAVPGDVESLVVPVSYGWGVEDSAVSFDQKRQIEEVHEKLKKETGAAADLPEMEHKVYRPGRHGFAVRGNPDDPLERKCLEDSLTQVLDWFQRWL
ncbi:Alpha/Beta hydrolase protein [Xylariales sp. PMI_506]|nr:Alpha/Beta hydrolase protein [Xylariales sp. PMI_506]